MISRCRSYRLWRYGQLDQWGARIWNREIHGQRIPDNGKQIVFCHWLRYRVAVWITEIHVHERGGVHVANFCYRLGIFHVYKSGVLSCLRGAQDKQSISCSWYQIHTDKSPWCFSYTRIAKLSIWRGRCQSKTSTSLFSCKRDERANFLLFWLAFL